jgi:ubiquinone/menaquinone biosynthesis C-methylase UbiE
MDFQPMGIKGVVDRFSVRQVSGWAYETDSTDDHLFVTATLDGKTLGSAVASGFRADLMTAGIGKGDHAFAINLAPPLAEADAARLAIGVAVPDGSARKQLPVPKVSAAPPLEAMSNTGSAEWVQEQIKKFLKYGNLYAQSRPLDPPAGLPGQFVDDALLAGNLEIKGYLSRVQVSPEQIRQDITKDTCPIPGSNNREGYAVGRDLAYWVSGYAEYVHMSKVARTYGVNGGRYFDFGGSTGRIFRHFALQSDAWDVWSCDFKETSVAFNLQYFPSKVRSFLNTSFPSLPLPDAYFDLISACSVFTHINETETSWLLELRRTLKVGGVACITILNDATWPKMAPPLRQTIEKFRPDIATATALPEGKTVVTFRDDDPYNCNVLHSDSYIRQNWGRFFEICEIQPLYLNTQAMVVCRRRD